jgi:hypothetical protein
MGFWLRWGGILLAAVSLFSLMQKLANFGIAPVLSDMLNFYRAALHPIAERVASGLRWVFTLVSIGLPVLPSDAVIIYILAGSALTRGLILLDYQAKKALVPLNSIRETFRNIVFGIFWPLSILLGIYRIFTRAADSAAFKSWGSEIAKVIATFLILFGTNAYFSS